MHTPRTKPLLLKLSLRPLQVCHGVVCDCLGSIALNPLLACSLVGCGQVLDAAWSLQGTLPLSCRQCNEAHMQLSASLVEDLGQDVTLLV
jgi:hypothetical protein